MDLTTLSALVLGIIMIQSCRCHESWTCPKSCSCRVKPNAPTLQNDRGAAELIASCNEGVREASTPLLEVQARKLVRLEINRAGAEQLRDLIHGLPDLQNLRINNGAHTVWHSLFSSGCCRNLSTLVIRRSKIKNLQSDTFVKLAALTHLDLSYNELVSTFPATENDAVVGLGNDDPLIPRANDTHGNFNLSTEKIDVEQPEKKDTPFQLLLPPAVQELLLAHNNITDIEMLNSSSLKVLDLSYNFIPRLEPAKIVLPELKKLSIGGSFLKLQRGLLSPATLPKVQTLELLGTAHQHLSLSRGVERDVQTLLAQQLTSLTLHHCRLSSLALVMNVPGSRLQHLSVTNSTLLATRTMAPPFNMSFITSLNFQGTPFLAKNFLNPPGSQKYHQTPLPQLATLVVANAEVETLPVNILTRLPGLKELDISSNPLHCTCKNFAWLAGFVALNRLTLMNADKTTCAFPPDLAGKPILQEDLCNSKHQDATTVTQELSEERTSSPGTSVFNTSTSTRAPSLQPSSTFQQSTSQKKAPASLESSLTSLYDKDISYSFSLQNISVAVLVAIAFLGLLVKGRQNRCREGLIF